MGLPGVAISPVPLHWSKLERPQVSGTYVPRAQLEARLDRTLTTPLTIITAPAGHGKTRTLVEWVTKRAPATAWVTLGHRDSDLTQCAAHVAAALDRALPGVAPPLFAQLSAPDRLTPGALGEVFGDTLYDLPHDLVLILDDFHAAHTGATADFVAGLVLAAPARLHTILSSRTLPSLPLARLRTLGRVDELTAANLRFSEQETAAMLSAETGDAISWERAAHVHAAVGGWPAAVRLLAIGANAGQMLDEPSTLSTAPGEHLLLDYLTEEVLSQLTPLQRGLLLRASLPERFNAALLEALIVPAEIGDAGSMELENLRRLDLFREIPGLEETWFAYHPLFRETFRRQLLSDLGPAAIADLHRDYATWFARAGFTKQAIWHLVRAGDFAMASALIESRMGEAFGQEDWQAVASWLQLIPESDLVQRPELLLASAWVAHLGGRGGAMVSRFGHLHAMREQGELSDAQIAEVDLLSVGAALLSNAERRHAVPIAENLIPRIPSSHRYRFGFAHLMLGLALGADGRVQDALDRLAAFTIEESARIDAASIRGFFGRVLVFWQAGMVSSCEQSAADLLELAHRNGLPVSAGWGHAFLGMTTHERGDLTAAEHHFAAVIANAERLHFACVREAFSRQVLIFEAQGKATEADLALTRWRELIMAIEAPEHLAICDSLTAHLALSRGDLSAARKWLFTVRPDSTRVELLHLENPLMTRAMVLIAHGIDESLREAATVLEGLRRHAEAAHVHLPLIDIKALTALYCEATGDRAGATAALRISLAHSAEAQVATRYSFLPLPLGPILRRLLAEPAPPPNARTVLELVESATRARHRLDPPAMTAPEIGALTNREHDVLDCLSRRLTNDEISQELFISTNTVRNHVAHVCDKLGVSGRRAVVMRARELGLIA